MTPTEPQPDRVRAGWLRRIAARLLKGAGFVVLALVLAWGSLALCFSTLPWAWLRLALAIAFAAFGIWALWLTPRPGMRWGFAGLYLAVLVGWSFILPSHDRDWRPDVAVMPRATIDGDRVRISGVRKFDYRSRDPSATRSSVSPSTTRPEVHEGFDPFAELRRQSRVNPSVNAAEPVEEFSQHIRGTVPGMTP
jgi:hypothetical protein